MISAHSKTHFPAPFLCWNWLHHWRCTPYLHAAVSQSHPWKSDAVSTLLNSPTESLYNNEVYPGESTDPLWCTCLTEGQWGIARGKHWPSVVYLSYWGAMRYIQGKALTLCGVLVLLRGNEVYPGESTDPLWCTCLTEGQWGISRGKHWPSVVYLSYWGAMRYIQGKALTLCGVLV